MAVSGERIAALFEEAPTLVERPLHRPAMAMLPSVLEPGEEPLFADHAGPFLRTSLTVLTDRRLLWFVHGPLWNPLGPARMHAVRLSHVLDARLQVRGNIGDVRVTLREGFRHGRKGALSLSPFSNPERARLFARRVNGLALGPPRPGSAGERSILEFAEERPEIPDAVPTQAILSTLRPRLESERVLGLEPGGLDFFKILIAVTPTRLLWFRRRDRYSAERVRTLALAHVTSATVKRRSVGGRVVVEATEPDGKGRYHSFSVEDAARAAPLAELLLRLRDELLAARDAVSSS